MIAEYFSIPWPHFLLILGSAGFFTLILFLAHCQMKRKGYHSYKCNECGNVYWSTTGRCKNDFSRIEKALTIAWTYGMIDGDHHKKWVIDQMVRTLTDCPEGEDSEKYKEFCRRYSGDPENEDEYYGEWAENAIPP